MTIIIKGDNNGIAVEGSLKIEHLDFEFGKGIKSVSRVHDTTKEECDYSDAVEIVDEDNVDFDSKLKNVTDLMWRENVLSHKYDYAFIKMYMDSTKGGFPMFKTTPDFLQYLSRINRLKVPSQSTFNSYYDIDKIVDGRIHLKYDKAEEDRANMIISKFVELMK